MVAAVLTGTTGEEAEDFPTMKLHVKEMVDVTEDLVVAKVTEMEVTAERREERHQKRDQGCSLLPEVNHPLVRKVRLVRLSPASLEEPSQLTQFARSRRWRRGSKENRKRKTEQ